MQPPHSDAHRPGHSTGPRSSDGKSRSSRNSLQHGCCSQILILPDENEADFDDLKEGWLADYHPETTPAFSLVLEAVKAQWFLLRAQRCHDRVLLSVYQKESDPLLWTEEQHKTVERFTRYRTAAERAFHRAFNDLEHLRKVGQTIASCRPPASTDAPAPAPPKPESPKPAFSRRHALFHGQNAKKNQRKIPILDQWADITIENGRTVTMLYPSNEQLIKDGQAMDPPPELIYRRLNFVDGVPSEYHWATRSLQRRERGGLATQRMTVDTWLETIDREAAGGTGHLGPCGSLLPRPKERGGCDCPVCTKLSAEAETG